MEFKIRARRFREHLLIGDRLYVDGDDRYDNNGPNHEVKNYNDLDLDKVSYDIDNEGASDDENVNASSFRNPSKGIVIRNDLRAHMSVIDPDAMHASEFLEYSNILPAH
ncbi:hypothetical protein GOBAR_DD26662 [Gossypium barbadense]|nr:hypothetical protein GOBAR_DD26662 [Gossypium barbadense]